MNRQRKMEAEKYNSQKKNKGSEEGTVSHEETEMETGPTNPTNEHEAETEVDP